MLCLWLRRARNDFDEFELAEELDREGDRKACNSSAGVFSVPLRFAG